MANAQAFTVLIRVLESVKQRELPFNMLRWMSEHWTNAPVCKTAHCAAGWAAEDTIANVMGFHMGRPPYDAIAFVQFIDPVTKRRFTEFNACAEWLCIEKDVAHRLFDPMRYHSDEASISVVLERVKQYYAISCPQPSTVYEG